MRGNRAIYLEGWKAVAIHKRGTDFEIDPWDLHTIGVFHIVKLISVPN
jgi:hypothetical protein